MKLRIKNLAVAALLSTTLMSSVMAATIGAIDLDGVTGDVGKALAPLLLHPEVAYLKSLVEDATYKGTPLYSDLAKPALIDLIAKCAHGFGIKNATLRDNFFVDEGIDVSHIDRLLVGKSARQLEAEAVDTCWGAFLTSPLGVRLADKVKANADAEIRFGSATGSKASDFLAHKPGTLAGAEELIREATDYYDVNQALPRAIKEVRDLRRSLIESIILPKHVEILFSEAGFYDLGKLSSADGWGCLREALEKIKMEHDALKDERGSHWRLEAENKELKKMVADIKNIIEIPVSTRGL